MPVTYKDQKSKGKYGVYGEELKHLFRRASDGDSAAQSVIVEKNLGLVHACAKRFSGKGIDYDDLYQAGCMGLVKSVLGFDSERGVRFSTYAVPVIMGEMRRLFRDDGPVKISRTLKENSLKAARLTEKLRISLGREPTIGELSEKLGLDMAETAQALEAGVSPLSLTEYSEDGEDGTQTDVPVDSGEEKIVDVLALKEAIGVLPAEDRKLIILRYFQMKTQSETAQILGMTQVQISRRERKILSSLKKWLSG